VGSGVGLDAVAKGTYFFIGNRNPIVQFVSLMLWVRIIIAIKQGVH